MSLDIADTTLNTCPYIVCHDFDLIYYMHTCCNILIILSPILTMSCICATVHKKIFSVSVYFCVNVVLDSDCAPHV